MAVGQSSMKGKICLVTGATSGIGKATAMGLAKLGADVIIGCRDQSKGERVKQEIAAVTGNAAGLDLFVADLSSMTAIKAAAAKLKQKYAHLDVLVNQAGLYVNRYQETKDGFEIMFAVNHLAYFCLTLSVLDLLKASKSARIVNGSGGIEGAAKINFDDLHGKTKFNSFKAIAQSKLGNFLFTYELARRLKGTNVTVNIMHPGGVKTELGKGQGGLFGVMLRMIRPFMSTPEVGADTLIWLASAAELQGVSGKFYVKRKAAKSSAQSQDSELAKRLWDVSAKLCAIGID